MLAVAGVLAITIVLGMGVAELAAAVMAVPTVGMASLERQT
tara:strand:- start:994 stop:1116 length:123 start_codon:yes stop_codon:yes gene_type:complete